MRAKPDFILSTSGDKSKKIDRTIYYCLTSCRKMGMKKIKLESFKKRLNKYLNSAECISLCEQCTKTIQSYLRELYSKHYPLKNYDIAVDLQNFIVFINQDQVTRREWNKNEIALTFEQQFYEFSKYKITQNIKTHKAKATKYINKIQKNRIKIAYKNSINDIMLNFLK